MSYSCSDFTDDVLAKCVSLGLLRAEDIPDDDPETQAGLVFAALTLVSAAPDMLAALEKLERFFDSFTDLEGSELTGAYLSLEGQEAIEAARAAIRKAKGEA
jgi:hypothetical protein